jgi:hypothetical protein
MALKTGNRVELHYKQVFMRNLRMDIETDKA